MGFQIRFENLPGGPDNPARFVELEDWQGRGVGCGEWVQDGDTWLLKLPEPQTPGPRLQADGPALDTGHLHATRVMDAKAFTCAVCETRYLAGVLRPSLLLSDGVLGQRQVCLACVRGLVAGAVDAMISDW